MQLKAFVEQPLVVPFIQVVAVDQPLFFHSRFDPVRLKEIKTLDEVAFEPVEVGVGILSRFDRLAIARQHVEMRRARKRFDSRFDRIERRLHQRPFPPTAFDPLACKRHVRVVTQCGLNGLEGCSVGTRVKVDCDVIANSGQAQSLTNDRVRVFVTQKNKGNICHSTPVLPDFLPLSFCDTRVLSLNKPHFFDFLFT